MRERVANDVRTGKLSDQLADTIIAFCKATEQAPVRPIAEELFVTFLSEVRNCVWRPESAGARPLKLAKRLNLKQRFERTRPLIEGDQPFITHQAKWLANLLIALAPIWERATEKAGRRSKELRIDLTKSTPIQLYQQKIIHLAEVSATPPRRSVYPEGARRLKKQGASTT
jgi:hypothetical protein